jgi:hypothetical protein
MRFFDFNHATIHRQHVKAGTPTLEFTLQRVLVAEGVLTISALGLGHRNVRGDFALDWRLLNGMITRGYGGGPFAACF